MECRSPYPCMIDVSSTLLEGWVACLCLAHNDGSSCGVASALAVRSSGGSPVMADVGSLAH